MVDALVRWAPAKVFVESQPEFNQLAFDSLMQSLTTGSDLPRRNEIYRLGMRTAQRLGQQRVYLVDNPGRYGSLYGQMAQVADAMGKRDVMEGRGPFVQRALYENESTDDKRLSMTLPAYLQYLNSAEYRRTDHGVYISRLSPHRRRAHRPLRQHQRIGAGAELVADWYRRNVMIYSKVLNWMDWSERRVVIVIGAGHVPILRHLFESHGSFRVVEVADVFAAAITASESAGAYRPRPAPAATGASAIVPNASSVHVSALVYSAPSVDGSMPMSLAKLEACSNMPSS